MDKILDLIDTSDIALGGLIITAIVAGVFIAKLILHIIVMLASLKSKSSEQIIERNVRGPLRFLIPYGCVAGCLEVFRPEVMGKAWFIDTSKVFLVFTLTWLAMRLVHIVAIFAKRRFNVKTSNNLRARSAHTQITVMQRVVTFAVGILGLASLFMLFDQLRSIGVSLIASAGVAGIVIGFAAQKALGNLFAGIQIAFTQPIRIDDAVVVEGEWGWIEEITLTYVVVKIWDLRRLILPISYFIETPFQNWTRNSTELLGSINVYTDYTVSVEAIREKLKEVVEKSDLWDGKTQIVQVVDCKEDTMQIRLLASAQDSTDTWNLRCEIREKILNFIQDEYPEALPKTRAILSKADDEKYAPKGDSSEEQRLHENKTETAEPKQKKQ